MSRPRVCLFTLGGTIASVPRDDGDSVVPSLGADALVDAVPQLAEVAELEATTFSQIASGDLGQGDLLALDAAIRERFADGCAAAVVTQGTDSIEETAFTLDLLRDDERPVVVTGAMRNPALPGADGPANLLAAVQLAAAPAARGLGAVVVFADEIHCGRYVRKTHTSSVTTFRSEPVGPIGWIAEGVPRVALRPADRRWIDASTIGDPAPVALIEISPGEDGRLLDAVAELGYRGVVIAGLGGGHVPAALAEALEQVAASMPVVLASRTGSGEVLRHTYGFTGSEEDLLRRGLIAAGALDGPKARALLGLMMSAAADAADVARAFETFGIPPDAPVTDRFAIADPEAVTSGRAPR
jgi:L-asparaginase